jgi:SAM-dependent methyltransferase
MPDATVAAQLAADILTGCATAKTEEDVKVACEIAFHTHLPRIGVMIQPRYETSYRANQRVLSAGRSDAVYGQLVIEYERRGTLSRPSGCQHACDQLERYAIQESGMETPARVAGVAIDGARLVLVRFRRGREEPQALPLFADIEVAKAARSVNYDAIELPINEASVAELLVYFRALQRKPLSAGYLATDFGPRSPHAQGLVAKFLHILANGDEYSQAFYAEWDRVFGIVYGVEETMATKYIADLRALYDIKDDITLKHAFFATHTYFALLMKLIAAEVLSLQQGTIISSFLQSLVGCDEVEYRRKFSELESGAYFAGLGVRNFIEGDFFNWYLESADSELWRLITELCRELSNFEPATGTLDPTTTRDLLKDLYEALIPKSIRHHLGEYYTPDWLADFTLSRAGFEGALSGRILDPACGSGTFLALAIKRTREQGDIALTDRRVVAQKITDDIVGFDLNPLAVIAARTNYLLALGPLLRYVIPVTIPVYLCDSILTPLRAAGMQLSLGRLGMLGAGTAGTLADNYSVETTAGVFKIPGRIIADKRLSECLALLEEQLSIQSSVDTFANVAGRKLGYNDSAPVIESISELFDQLQRTGRNYSFWIRYLRNAFAPVLLGQFDFIIGNPPWIGWEEVSSEYRRATAPMWKTYGLFSLSGHDAQLGGGKKDLSMLLFYVAADNYLNVGGKIAVVITQSVLKSRKAGDGFRRFRIGSGHELQVNSVDDFAAVKPFEAANLTIVLVATKGEATEYPVPYEVWTKARGVRPQKSWTGADVEAKLQRRRMSAVPLSRNRRTAPWLTLPLGLEALATLLRPSAYVGQAGVSTWLNGVFFLNILDRYENGFVAVENLGDVGDIKVAKRSQLIEPDLVFPFALMRDVKRWSVKPSGYLLVPQDPEKRHGINVEIMRERYPRTLQFLSLFKSDLEKRSGFKKYHKEKKNPYYSIYNLSAETFAPYHVMWQQMREQLDAAVIGNVDDAFVGSKAVVTQHIVTTVPCSNEEEAHFIASWINSSFSTAINKASSTGKSFGVPSVLEWLAIPQFDPEDDRHLALVRISRRCHVEKCDSAKALGEIDVLVGDLLNLEDDVRESLGRFANVKYISVDDVAVERL